MPNWEPNWRDVRWNYGEAAALAAKLRRAAGQLDDHNDSRDGVGTRANEAWRGMHRASYDDYLPKAISESDGRAATLRKLAAQLDRLSEDARREQARREQARRRWREEKADEEREQARREQQQRQQSQPV
jgi:uncharacterized protein YukE